MKFEIICRICLKEGELKDIFETHKVDGEETIYCSDMLSYCSSLKVSPADGYPAQICKQCFNKLWSAYKFRRLSENSHELLTNYILENKETVKTEVHNDSSLIDFTDKQDSAYCDASESDMKVVIGEILIKAESSQNAEENFDFQDTFDDFVDDDDFDNEEKYTEETIEKDSLPIKKKRGPYKKKKKYNCTQCKKKFKDHLTLLKHEDRHNMLEGDRLTGDEKRKKTTCLYCPEQFYSKKVLLKHEAAHNGRKKQTAVREETPCPHCSKVFKNKASLEKHINEHLGIVVKTEKTLMCRYCNKKFKDKVLHSRHESSHLGLKTYYCERCKKSYRSELDHKTYCGKEGEYTCDLCSKNFINKPRLINHIRTHSDYRKKYACDYEGCSKVFLSAGGINKHKKLHLGVKIMCHLCSKEFSDKYLLQTHINRHNNERKYPCSYCEKKFFTSGAKLEHERRHTNTRPFPCTQCDKTFVSSTNLKRHTLWHEKNFTEQCRFCDKKFLVKGNRRTHEAIMHGVTRVVDESKYFCQERFKATRLPKVQLLSS